MELQNTLINISLMEHGIKIAITIYEEYLGKEISTAMMRRMLELLMEQGYNKASLAV